MPLFTGEREKSIGALVRASNSEMIDLQPSLGRGIRSHGKESTRSMHSLEFIVNSKFYPAVYVPM